MPHRAPTTSSRRCAKGLVDEASLSDLWDRCDNDGNAFATNKPQPVQTSETWHIPAESAFHPRDGPRRRAASFAKPNNRPAVAAPHPGQSVNPEYEDHQEALQKAVRKLEKQKESHQTFAKWLGQGTSTSAGGGNGGTDAAVGKSKHGGGMQIDHPGVRPSKRAREDSGSEGDQHTEEGGEEEADSAADAIHVDVGGTKLGRRGIPDASKKVKLVVRQATNRTRVHRRHPSRDVINDEIDEELPVLLEDLEKAEVSRREKLARRIAARREGLDTKKIGRHIHHPLPLDVQPTKDLAGALRHVKGGAVHPVQERVKSLEERNLIPARVRHQYNRRKQLKAKGDVLIRREPFGILPDTTDRH